MNTLLQTNAWISRTVIALSLILVLNLVSSLFITVMGQPLPEILVAFGFIATGGLVRLLISPLNQKYLSESESPMAHADDQLILDEVCWPLRSNT
jgi:hypothetical protein